MRISVALALCLLPVALLASATEQVQLASDDYSLSKEEEARLSELAYSGDGNAAYRLSRRYRSDMTGSRDENLKVALSWALIGAENGNTEADLQSFSLLRKSADRGQQIRALFWLKRAAKHGNSDAKAILRGCPTVDSMRRSNPRVRCFGPSAG